MNRLRGLTCLTLIAIESSVGYAQLAPDHPQIEECEERFREGLHKWELDELLLRWMTDRDETLALADGSTDGGEDRLDQALLRSRDANLDETQRQKSLEEAIALLRDKIQAADKNDDTRLDHMLELADLLTFSKAEPYINSILILGDALRDERETAVEVLRESLAILEDAVQNAEKRQKRIDLTKSEKRLEDLRNDGVVDRVAGWTDRSKWLLHCTLCCSATINELRSADQIEVMNRCIKYFKPIAQLKNSRAFYAANLFLGLAYGRRNESDEAVRALAKATSPDAAQWVQNLAHNQRIRFAVASATSPKDLDNVMLWLDVYQGWIRRSFPKNLTMSIAEGLLRVLALNRRAEILESGPTRDPAGAKSARAQANSAIESLAEKIQKSNRSNREKRRLRQIFFTIYGRGLRPDLKPGELTSWELFARGTADLMSRNWTEAASAFEALRGRTDPAARGLLSETLLFLGIAYNEMNEPLKAAEVFLAISNDTRTMGAPEALSGVVRVVSMMMAIDHARVGPESVEVLDKAYKILTERFPNASETRYWRYFRAQWLAGRGRHREASEQFGKVDESHELFSEARWNQVTELLQAYEGGESSDQDGGRTEERLVNLALEAGNFLLDRSKRESDPERKKEVSGWAGGCLLIAAEIRREPLKQPDKAIGGLVDFGRRFSDHQELVGRAHRLRALAYNDLGKYDQAAKEMESLLAGDKPETATAARGVLDAMRKEIADARRAGDPVVVKTLAKSRLSLAEKLWSWVNKRDDRIGPMDRYLYRRNLAEALFDADRFQEASELYSELDDEFQRLHESNSARDVTALKGHADSLFADGKYEEALPLFSEIHQRVESDPEAQPTWWLAILRNLQCLAHLDRKPKLICQSIAGLVEVDPNFHDPQLKAEFSKLIQDLGCRIDESGSGE
jgi:tetratricopeptide (TPR) repeat protein